MDASPCPLLACWTLFSCLCLQIPKQSKDGVRKMVKAMRLHQLLCYLLYDYKGSTDISPTTPCFTSATVLHDAMRKLCYKSSCVLCTIDCVTHHLVYSVLQIILCAVHYRLCYTSSCLQCTTDHLVCCAL